MRCFNQKLPLITALFFTGLLLANSTYYGDQYLREKNYYEALKHYQLAWKEDPGSLTLKNKIENCLLLIDAETFFKKGDYQSAKNSLELLNNEYSQPIFLKKIDQIETLSQQIETAVSELNLEQAILFLSEVLALNPDDQSALNLKIKLNENLLIKEAYQEAMLAGNYQLAKENATKLYSQYPNSQQAVNYLTVLQTLQAADELISKNRFLEAKKIYREILLTDSLLQEKAALKIKELDNLIYLETLGDFYFKEGELNKAREIYEQLMKLNSVQGTLSKKIAGLEKFRNNFLNAAFQLSKENYPAALKYLEENKKINPDHLLNNEYFLVAQIIADQQKKNNEEFAKQKLALLDWPAKKELALKTSFNNDPQQEEIYVAREIITWRQQGLIAFELKKYREAQANFARVLSYSPNDKIALLYYKKAGELIIN